MIFQFYGCEDVPELLNQEGLSLEEVEKGLIKTALTMSQGNHSETTRLLPIPRHVLISILGKFGI